MKKAINVSIGSRSFVLDEDAHSRLKAYLEAFRSKLDAGMSSEVMDEVETRLADIFSEGASSSSQVITLETVNRAIAMIGMPDGSPANDFTNHNHIDNKKMAVTKKFYRDPDNKVIGGVCGGIAAHFGIDVVLVRIIAIVALCCGSLGFWVYVILWIVAPMAKTAAQKCELRGLEANAENMAKYSQKK